MENIYDISGFHCNEHSYCGLTGLDTMFLIHLLCFWTLSIILFLFKTHNVSDIGFCLGLQVEPTQLGPTDRDSPYLRTPAQTQERIYKGYLESNIHLF
jgi:hypothetical protein